MQSGPFYVGAPYLPVGHLLFELLAQGHVIKALQQKQANFLSQTDSNL